MKQDYPRYSQGQIQNIQDNLSSKNKTILNEFANHCLINAGQPKVEKIKRLIVQFYDITEVNLDSIKKQDVDSFLVLLNKSDRSLWTKNEIKVYLRKFLKWKYRDLELIENIKGESKKEFNSQKINENNLVNEQDVEKMLRFAENFKEKALLFLEFESGARPQEIVNLKWQDIKFEEDYADITLYSGKTRQSRTFPVKKASKFLQEWKQNYSYPDVKQSDYVFPSRWRDKPMTTTGLNVALRRMVTKAGVKKDVWSYLFRHSRATRLYEELPQQIVEKLMGHKNMAGIYAHISSKKAREEMLNKIYHLEELPESKKQELELKIEKMQKKIEEMEKIEKQERENRTKFFDLVIKQGEKSEINQEFKEFCAQRRKKLNKP